MGEDIWKLLVNKGLMSRIYKKMFAHNIKTIGRRHDQAFFQRTYRWQTDT